ncbi:hypothetical protein [Vulgatibacter sp.]|uniref:hypothetical protein n=1 Tax=Vulgatibacter sp. TaxID=1971226 RepID=UPI003565A66E
METTTHLEQPPGRLAERPSRRAGRVPAHLEAAKRQARDPVVQAREILHLGFTVAPLVAGTDKFFDALVDWERYLDPRVAERLGMSPRSFMRLVGGIEVAAGLLVAAKPRLGSYVVAGWLGGIIGNLLTQRRYYDIALRDLGLLLGAVALGRLEGAR